MSPKQSRIPACSPVLIPKRKAPVTCIANKSVERAAAGSRELLLIMATNHKYVEHRTQEGRTHSNAATQQRVLECFRGAMWNSHIGKCFARGCKTCPLGSCPHVAHLVPTAVVAPSPERTCRLRAAWRAGFGAYDRYITGSNDLD